MCNTGSVTARFHVGVWAFAELLGGAGKAGRVSFGMLGRWATDVGGVLLVLLLTSAGDGHLKLWLLAKWLTLGGSIGSSRGVVT